MKKSFTLWRKDIPWYMNFHIRPVTINGYAFLILVLFLAWGYAQDIEQYQYLAENPCAYCDVEAVCAINDYGGDSIWMNKDIMNNSILDSWQELNITENTTS